MEAFIGSVFIVGFNFAPRQYTFCAGQTLTINDNSALFALIGSAYGGDGRNTLGIPDLRSRVPVGSNVMGNPIPPLFAYGWGQQAGNQETALGISHLPTHSHTASFTPIGGGGSPAQVLATTEDGTHSQPATGDYLAQPSDLPGFDAREHIFKANPTPASLVSLGGVSGGGGASGGTVTVNSTGAGSSFEIINPVLGMAYIIALEGVFPSRN